MTTRRHVLAAAAALLAVGPQVALAQNQQKGLTLADILRDAEAARMGPVDQYQLGRGAAVDLVAGQKLLPVSSAPAAYVRQVLDTLTLGSVQPLTYRGPVLGVLVNGDLNAYAAPGPFIFITTGMLRFLQDEEELAAILAHELAHTELGHTVYGVQNAKAGMTFMKATDNGFKDLLTDMANTIRTGYSVEIEAEADARAVQLLAAAGYRPTALVDMLERFKAQTNSYGGAKYPQQRTHSLLQKMGGLPQPEPASVAIRAERFRKAMAALPRNA